MNMDTVELILKIILFIIVAFMCGCFVKYLKDYKIISMFYTKLKGDIYAYDRIRREQMRKELERNKGVLNFSSSAKGIPFVSKIYRRIEMTGITLKFPAFSEMVFLIIFCITGLMIFAVVYVATSPMVGLIALVSYVVLIWYGLGIIVYGRKLGVESQLLQFTNSAASASRQYSGIIDIIGAIYDQFEGPFREALEICYVEAKTNNDNDLAFTHLKDKFDSVQLAFVIDNLVMCSASTGDYYTVATDLSKTVSIFTNSHEKKAVTLRNARINITVMFALAFLIMYGLGTFFENGFSVFLSTTVGNILCILLVFVYILGMNIRAD